MAFGDVESRISMLVKIGVIPPRAQVFRLRLALRFSFLSLPRASSLPSSANAGAANTVDTSNSPMHMLSHTNRCLIMVLSFP
jgi:hypothetical protein